MHPDTNPPSAAVCFRRSFSAGASFSEGMPLTSQKKVILTPNEQKALALMLRSSFSFLQET